MCGIIGYVGEQSARPRLVDGLQKLEYRGYDSAGIALADDGLSVFKRRGLIGDLDIPADTPQTCGIGHTRWSTHGKPTDENAHPHTDCTGRVAVVHNGIVGNYDELRASLPGHEFTSQTDTEVVAHLIEAELERTADLREAVTAVVERLEGSYALGVVAAGYDGIVAARRNSPLVVGHGQDGNFIASDVTPLLAHTRSVSYLEDGDVAHVTAGGVRVWSLNAFPANGPRSYVTPGSWATMGTGLPSGSGARLASEEDVVVLTGDGGLLMCLHELHTAVAEELPLAVVVLDNSDYAIISEEADRAYGLDEGYGWGGAPIDFVRVAEGLGMAATRAETPEAVRTAVSEALGADRPTLVQVPTDPEEPQASEWMRE